MNYGPSWLNYEVPWLIIKLHEYVLPLMVPHATACFNDNDQ